MYKFITSLNQHFWQPLFSEFHGHHQRSNAEGKNQCKRPKNPYSFKNSQYFSLNIRHKKVINRSCLNNDNSSYISCTHHHKQEHPKLVAVWAGFSALKSGYAAPKPMPIDTTPGTSKNISTVESTIIKGDTLSKMLVAMIKIMESSWTDLKVKWRKGKIFIEISSGFENETLNQTHCVEADINGFF